MQSNYEHIEALEDMWYGFNQEPEKRKKLFLKHLEKIEGFPIDVVKRSLGDVVRSEDYLPKIGKIVSHIKKNMPISTHLNSVECKTCNGEGLVFGIVACHKGGSQRVHSTNISDYPETYYFKDSVIGRCSCANGFEYANSCSASIRTVVESPSFLTAKANTRGMGFDNNLEARLVSVEMNERLRASSNE